MADVQIRETALRDVADLAINLRAADAREIRAYGHQQEVMPALIDSALRSTLCWTATIDGEVAAILGCTPLSLLSGQGSPWMMGTPVLDRHSRILVRHTPGYIARMLAVFPHLVNYVHAENATSIRWLRRLGFTVYPPVPYGAPGEIFHPFELRA